MGEAGQLASVQIAPYTRVSCDLLLDVAAKTIASCKSVFMMISWWASMISGGDFFNTTFWRPKQCRDLIFRSCCLKDEETQEVTQYDENNNSNRVKNNSKTRSGRSFSFHSFQCVSYLLLYLVLMFLFLKFVLQKKYSYYMLFWNCQYNIDSRYNSEQIYIAMYLFSICKFKRITSHR